jgi:glycosyltransferase involved in cell wall biosynthesis
MKILILNYEYPPLGGGAGVVSGYHADGLAILGHTVSVCTTWFTGEKTFEKKGNLSVYKLKSRRKYIYKSNPLEWISWIQKAKQFLNIHLKENNYDYCFAHFALPGGEVARFLKKKFNLPYAIVSHGQDIPWFFPRQMFKYHFVTYFWIKQICKNADKLILLTQAMKNNADRFMGRLSFKGIIIPNGCDTNTFYPDYTKRGKQLKVLFIGRLVRQKDPFTLLEAVKIIKRKGFNDFTVHILGDGPLKVKMENYIKRNKLSEIIQMKGWVNKNELLEEFQSAHIQIITSKAEAMSIAALESLAAGLYIISTPVSGNTDIIKQNINGEFFKFGNAKELAEKTIRKIDLHQRSQELVTRNSIDSFRSEYDWSNIIKKIEAVFQNQNK